MWNPDKPTSAPDHLIEHNRLGVFPMVAGSLEVTPESQNRLNFVLLQDTQKKIEEIVNKGRKIGSKLDVGRTHEGSAEFRGPSGRNALIVFPGPRRDVDDLLAERAIIYFYEGGSLHVLQLEAEDVIVSDPGEIHRKHQFGVTAMHSKQTRQGLKEVLIDDPVHFIRTWLLAAQRFDVATVEHAAVVTWDYGREAYIKDGVEIAIGRVATGVINQELDSSMSFGLQQVSSGEGRVLTRILETALREESTR